jgi:hypothetical protein
MRNLVADEVTRASADAEQRISAAHDSAAALRREADAASAAQLRALGDELERARKEEAQLEALNAQGAAAGQELRAQVEALAAAQSVAEREATAAAEAAAAELRAQVEAHAAAQSAAEREATAAAEAAATERDELTLALQHSQAAAKALEHDVGAATDLQETVTQAAAVQIADLVEEIQRLSRELARERA